MTAVVKNQPKVAAPKEPAAASPSMKLAQKPAKEPAAPAAVTQEPETLIKDQAGADVTEGQDLTGDQIVATATEIEHLSEAKAFKLVPTLLADIDRNFFRMGGVLSRIHSSGWFMDKGYETFRQYVEAETTIGFRKARYLIGIYNGLVASGVPWEKVKDLGWTKLSELAPHLTPENVDAWLLEVNGLTTLQIQALIAQKSAAAAAPADAPPVAAAAKVTTMTFKVHPDQKDTIRAALNKAKAEGNTDVDTVALEYICLDFLGGESKLKVSLADLMKGKTAVDVLTVFGEVFPDVGLEVSLPES